MKCMVRKMTRGYWNAITFEKYKGVCEMGLCYSFENKAKYLTKEECLIIEML